MSDINQQVQQPAPQPAPQPGVNVPSTPDNSANALGAYESIIAQQQAQIEALIAQTNAQSEQITRLVQGGAQITQVQQQPQQGFIPQQPQPQPMEFPNVYQPYDAQAASNANWKPPSMLDDQDYSLESLGKEIGK